MSQIRFEDYLRRFDYQERVEMKIQLPELFELYAQGSAQVVDIRFHEEYAAWRVGIARQRWAFDLYPARGQGRLRQGLGDAAARRGRRTGFRFDRRWRRNAHPCRAAVAAGGENDLATVVIRCELPIHSIRGLIFQVRRMYMHLKHTFTLCSAVHSEKPVSVTRSLATSS